jgi:urease accessory protein
MSSFAERIAATDPCLPSWEAELDLEFATCGDRTLLTRRRHSGPLCIQRPFYPEDGVCHVYVLHPPGGLAGGDRLTLDVALAPGAEVLLTTPAATKFYRSETAPSTQTQRLSLAVGASLEWLPLETLLFGGSRASIQTRIELARNSRFIGWEQSSLGRPLSGDHYADGSLDMRTEIFVDGEPLLLERLRWKLPDATLTAPWGLAGHGAMGVLYVYPGDTALLVSARAMAAGLQGLLLGATLLDDLLVLRALSARPEDLRLGFEAIWAGLRFDVIGKRPSPPRIWRT